MVYVGIDVSKDTFDVCFLENNNVSYTMCEMNRKGFNFLQSYLEKYDKTQLYICFETTGIYYYNLADFLLSCGYMFTADNPYLISNYAKSMSLRLKKNDKADAKKCAYYCEMIVQKGFFRQYRKQEIEDLRSYIRFLDRLTKNLARVKITLKSKIQVLFPEFLAITKDNYDSDTALTFLRLSPSARILRENPDVVNDFSTGRCEWTKEDIITAAKDSIGGIREAEEEIIKELVDEVFSIKIRMKKITDKIHEIIKTNSGLKANIDVLSSIKGISGDADGSAVRFLVEAGIYGRNIKEFYSDYKKLMAYMGCVPTEKQSGTSVNAKSKMEKRGNPLLRKFCFDNGMLIIRHNPVFKIISDYHEIINKKSKRAATICTMGKVIPVLYKMLANMEKYDENKIHLNTHEKSRLIEKAQSELEKKQKKNKK